MGKLKDGLFENQERIINPMLLDLIKKNVSISLKE